MKPSLIVTKDSNFPVYRKVKKGLMETGFVREDSLRDLTEPERYVLLYFKKRTESEILDDTPVLGAVSYRFRESAVQGPYQQPPRISDKERIHNVFREEIVNRFIPLDKLPVSLYPLYIARYGLNSRELQFVQKSHVKKLEEIRKGVGEKTKQIASKFNETRTGINALVDGSLLHYRFCEDVYPHPNIYVSILTRERKSIPKVFREIGIYDLNSFELHFVIDAYVLDNNISQGVSFGEFPFPLSKKGIEDILKEHQSQIII